MKHEPIEDLVNHPDNPKTIRDSKFLGLIKSIRTFPKMLEKRPLICRTREDGKKVIYGGNQRYKAAVEAGLTYIPVEMADDWTQEEANEFMIRDNVISGDWDWKMLGDWDMSSIKEWGVTPFEVAEKKPLPPSKFEKTGNRGIMIDFSEMDYEEAKGLIDYFKEKREYLGAIIINTLKDKKASE